ncbi:MAG: diamine N-acetyltransferase [Microbacteriaceae bacterium]|nr:diamine N-acetyltransferase [Microbacteriaceae bacterium]
MTIRIATPADAIALAEVGAVTFPLACPPGTPREAIDDVIAAALSEAAFARYLADPERLLLVDDPADGGPLAGYTMLVLAEPGDPDVLRAVRIRPTCELSKCYVRPGHQGSGTASVLMEHSVAAARDRGAAGMWLGTNQANARAIRFYEKHGFVPVGERRFRLGDRLEHDFVLELALT